MNGRIKQLRKYLGFNQKEFSAQLGVQQSTISYIEKDGSTVTEQNLKAICNQFKANEHWLRTGEGKMLDDDVRWQEFKSIFDKLRPPLQDYIISTGIELLKTQGILQNDCISEHKTRAESLSALYQNLPVNKYK